MTSIIKNGQTPEFYFQERCHIAELLNSADCPGVSIARARVEPGVTTVLHIVRGADEIYYCLFRPNFTTHFAPNLTTLSRMSKSV